MIKQLNLDSIAEGLTPWLCERAGAGVSVGGLRTPTAGMSNDTVLFELDRGNGTRETMVARLAPTEQFVFPAYDISLQYKVMDALAATAVPVPPVRWLEEDAAVLGTPFYVMSAVEGEVPAEFPPYHAEGFCFEASPAERESIWWNGIGAMAEVHKVDWQDRRIDFLGTPSGPQAALDAQLAYWRDFFDWARTEEPQLHIEEAARWLEASRPASPGMGLCWGDSRLGNILYKDLEVVAVLDWEMAFIGDPEADLAWWLFLDWHHSDGYGIPRLEGLPGRAETLARYQTLTGHEPRDLHYYEVFSAYRFALIMIRVVGNMRACGIDPPVADFASNNPCIKRLADLLELPAPAGGYIS